MVWNEDSDTRHETGGNVVRRVQEIDDSLIELANTTDQRTLALWAAECAERVLPLFEQRYPDDSRPSAAIDACRAWTRGEIRVSEARTAALAAHAAARAAIDGAARAAARAAGHAVATAHVPRHALGAAMYANRAVFCAGHYTVADEAIRNESDWHRKRLLELRDQ